MKIYIVTKGAYSDYSIYGVFTDRELAEKYVLLITDRYDDANIEEYESDVLPSNPEIEKGELPFDVYISKDDNDIDVQRESVSDTFSSHKWIPYGNGKDIVFQVWAKDKDEAVKNAKIMKQMYISELEYDWVTWRSKINRRI